MYVLGLNIGPHDPSAALLRDGSLRWLVEQERVSRHRHAVMESPAGAARACLEAEGISLESVSVIALGWDLRRTLLGKSRLLAPNRIGRRLFPELPQSSIPPIRWVPHHLAHAASAYYSSGVDEAAILVFDAAGETQSTTIARGHGGTIEILREWPISQSLGLYYGLASEWAGLGLYWGAGKLMGLASYGRPQGGLAVRRLPGGYLVVDADGVPLRPPDDDRDSKRLRRLVEVPGFFRRAMEAQFAEHFPYAPRRDEDAIAFADFAASVQFALEQAALGLAEEARRRVDAANLILAGGIAMNCSMVGKLVRSGKFGRVYAPPVPTDAGASLGAALVVASEYQPFAPTVIDHAYWGPPIDSKAGAEAIGGSGLICQRLSDENLAERVARAVARGKLVGWARGRAEIGERALGARSILADPRNRRSLERLNLVKGREMWRPVAPSVLAEHIDDVMDGPVGDPARFMLSAGLVRPSLRRSVPAVTHVDGSTRPQLVERAANPTYWTMIQRFFEQTGIPAVINTSFNLAGEPIVHTAADAVSSFVRSDLDFLVLDNLFVAKSEAAFDDLAEGNDSVAKT